MLLINIHTDGACSGNPGPGGWAAIIDCGGKEEVISGGETITTNNKMELQAAISALLNLSGKFPEDMQAQVKIKIFTDSQYLQKGISEWIKKWKKNNWRTANKKPVVNVDLWRKLDKLCGNWQGDIEWHWVKGHDNDKLNQRADNLARAALARYRPIITEDSLI